MADGSKMLGDVRQYFQDWGKDLKAETRRRIITGVVVLGLGAISAGAWAAWLGVKSWVLGEIVAAVAADLESTGQIAAVVDRRVAEAVEGAFKVRVGAVSTGRVVLNSKTRHQIVPLYLPPGHSADFYVNAQGIAAGEHVILNSRRGARRLERDGAFQLPSDFLLGSTDDVQANIIASEAEMPIDPIQGEMEHLVLVTFRLTRTDPAADNFESEVDLRYLTLISPPIKVGGQ